MIETELQEFLDKEINLDQARISQGSRSHTYIRDLLVNKRITDPTFPWLLDGDFLSGSYGRGTKLHPLDDIDVMIVLDGTGLIPVGLNTTHYVRGNAENKKSPVHNHLGSDTLLNSHSVLEAFHKALAQSHSNSTIKKNGQAINVKLDSYNLGIDIVPCFHIKPLDATQKEFYYIPLGNGNPGWLKTNPKIDADISTTLHNRHNKKLKSIIKLLKYWNREKNADRIKSYHLEAIAWYVFHNSPSTISAISQGIRYFFNNGRSYLESQLYEPTGFGGIVDTYMTPEDRQASLVTFDRARTALNSMGLITANTQSWKAILGDKFGN
jgi:hypothetical protein